LLIEIKKQLKRILFVTVVNSGKYTLFLYSNKFKMHDSVGIRNVLGKALIVENGYSLVKINNVA